MDLTIRPIISDELPRYHRAMEGSFGSHVNEQGLEHMRRTVVLDRALGAFDGTLLIGTAEVWPFRLTTPGGEVALAGVTGVGVLPTHRRRGVLTALMRRQLDDVRDLGEPMAGLFASEGSIYGRFGYGVATHSCRLEVERDRARFVHEVEDPGRVVLAERDAAMLAMPEVYDRLRVRRAGLVDRPERVWLDKYRDAEDHRHGASALFFVLHEAGGRVDGYVSYRIKRDWADGVPNASVFVEELIAENLPAYAALWRFCFGIDLTTRAAAWGRPVDEPLLLMVTEPRRLRFRVGDGLYLRILDVPASLAGRRYGAEGRLVFEVSDPFCPWVEGRYELTGGPDGAECRPTDADPDVRLSVVDLSAAYLGGVGFRALDRAGRVDEDSPGALARADAMFATDPAPWCPFSF
jgi:predicted acetyltransferase